MRVRAITVGTLLLSATLPAVGVAQVTGLPVRNSGVSSGLTLSGEVGFPDHSYGKGTAYGGRATLGLGFLGISALVSQWDPDGAVEAQTGYGGYLNLKVFGGPLVPFSATLQGGAEYRKQSGIEYVHAPIGLGIALRIPNPALAIKPWIAPRVDVFRVSGSAPSNTTTQFGISGGIDFSLLGGIGFGAAYDQRWAGDGVNPSVFSVGASYTLKIPGL